MFLIYAMARRRQLPAGQPIMYALAPGHEVPQSAEVYLGLEDEQRAEAQVQQAQEQRG